MDIKTSASFQQKTKHSPSAFFFSENKATTFNDSRSPGEMHGAFTSHTEVEVGCVSHLIRVSRFLDPVANRVAVHSIHNVAVIVTTASIMTWAATWIWQIQLSDGSWTKYPNQCFHSEISKRKLAFLFFKKEQIRLWLIKFAFFLYTERNEIKLYFYSGRNSNDFTESLFFSPNETEMTLNDTLPPPRGEEHSIQKHNKHGGWRCCCWCCCWFICKKRSPKCVFPWIQQWVKWKTSDSVTSLTLPYQGVSGSSNEFEPQRLSERLGQLHVDRPQTRFTRWRQLPRGGHLKRPARLPVTQFHPRTHDEHFDVGRFRSEDDTEPKQHV